MKNSKNPIFIKYMMDNYPERFPTAESVPDIQAKWNKKGNIKVGNLWTLSTLYGDMEHTIPDLQIDVVGTCGKYCAGCKKGCYVPKSYRHPSVKVGHGRNTLALRADIAGALESLSGYIDRARNKPTICRFDQSGEIENESFLNMFIALAERHPEIKFYIYTKAYDIIIPALLAGRIPNNLIVNISIWHLYGIEEFKRVSHLENVKAFAVVDKDFTVEKYAEHGIIIETMCNAYNEHGKMNHDISCEKCGKCFETKRINFKVIGCYEH